MIDPSPIPFDILACPECRISDTLSLRPASPESAALLRHTFDESRPVAQEIVCGNCGRSYPVTWDGIPILWSDALRGACLSIDQELLGQQPTERDVKAANIRVYEATIGDYHDAEIHADSASASRLVAALDLCKGVPKGWHVDVGCGGGNVLEVVNSTGIRPQIGIDVSLAALRIVRQKGYPVVLGDAECLPLANSSIAVLTASSVLHHLFAPNRLITEVHRALKPKGIFFSDFDPNKDAADWGPIPRLLFELRLPIYRLLSRRQRTRTGHRSQTIQRWNKIAEFHNAPGAGFSPIGLARSLEQAGLEVRLILRHTTKGGAVANTHLVRPSLRALCTQSLSLRNPFLRKNADTLLTLSQKPEHHTDEHAGADAHEGGEQAAEH